MKKVDKDNPDYSILSARSYSLKTVANAMYGYLGFAKSRWYCLECAASITAWGREVISDLIKTAEKEGFEVIYADTDSVFLNLKGKVEKTAQVFLEKVNKTLPGVMELELQGIYPKGLFVSKKGGEGAKKRYVLLDEKGDLIVKGFQSVRRDWSKIAKNMQVAVMKAILIDESEEDAVKIIKEVINKLRSGDVNINDIVIHTQLTKKVEHYDAIGPHVAAVIKAQKNGHTFVPGQIIKYVVTKGEGSISNRSYILKEYLAKELEYDADYYIDHQVLPAVEKIFEVLGYSKEELKGKVQTKLEGFFK
jgi:DNA polymerase Pol2